MYAISARGVLKIRGGRYHVESNTGTTNLCIRVDATSKELIIDGCTVSIRNTYGSSGSFYARAIQNQGKKTVINNSEILAVSRATYAVGVLNAAVLHMTNTTVKADAIDCHSGGMTAIAMDLREGGNCYLNNCNVYGTHSGIQSSGNLYVNGGTYTGYCHGGFYFNHKSNVEAYVNDALMRAGNYEGEFDYSGKTSDIYGAFYIGGTNNVEVYLDNCTIDGTDCTQGAFVIRSSSGETNNTVNISNSNVENGAVRIDPNSGHRVNIGMGCNFTPSNTTTPTDAVSTNDLYSRNHRDKVLDGNDFNAIVNALNAWKE
jgi:hypothetical protein